ncbi:MAG: adenylosuccinate synthetase [Rhodocyclaceae bacterium]|nr:adenylosuccinate synthetase [Rhodocyclaceae bacterium]MCW5597173.1 adenylosuccinate synthetase [Rhodocyclaceae bacterium]
MPLTIVALSGPVCSGKSTLADLLMRRLSAVRLKTNDLIRELNPKARSSRTAFQKAGDRLDKETGGRWIADAVVKLLGAQLQDQHLLVVVDAVRIEPQLHFLRRVYPSAIVHVHLDASNEELAKRYAARPSRLSEVANYKILGVNRTEAHVRDLSRIADVVIETDRATEDDVFIRVAARIGFPIPRGVGSVDVIVGGQYGSEGKGNIVSYMAPEYDVLVRVGGPNAGHKVYRPDEEPFTFHQLPSGALANSEALLVLGAGAVISLQWLMREIADLSVTIDRLAIDPQSMIIEQGDIDWETAKLKDEIASTAQGVGSATARKILRSKEFNIRLARDVPELKHYCRDTVEVLSVAMSKGQRIMLEGTQGTSLSIHHGHYPHVTSRVTTAPGCLAEAGLAPQHVRRVVMVCRTYPIRVGDTDTGETSGFMSQVIDLATIADRSKLDLQELERIERTSTTNRHRKIAEFDWKQFRRAMLLNGTTDIALTFADYICKFNRQAYRYEQLTDQTLRFIEELEKVSGVPVSLISTNFGLRNIIDRRAW